MVYGKTDNAAAIILTGSVALFNHCKLLYEMPFSTRSFYKKAEKFWKGKYTRSISFFNKLWLSFQRCSSTPMETGPDFFKKKSQ